MNYEGHIFYMGAGLLCVVCKRFPLFSFSEQQQYIL